MKMAVRIAPDGLIDMVYNHLPQFLQVWPAGHFYQFGPTYDINKQLWHRSPSAHIVPRNIQRKRREQIQGVEPEEGAWTASRSGTEDAPSSDMWGRERRGDRPRDRGCLRQPQSCPPSFKILPPNSVPVPAFQPYKVLWMERLIECN